MRLRQSLAQDLEALSAVADPRDHQLALAWDALFVLNLWHEPSGIRVAWMHGDSEAERRRLGERKKLKFFDDIVERY